MLPATLRWARSLRISPSKLLLPLSYAAILGGTCTMIGTSTNLVVNGLLIKQTGYSLALFDIAWVGIPCALAGLGFILLYGRRLLPNRVSASATFEDPREYTVELIVDPAGPLVDRTIGRAGLRDVEGLYLIEIEREGRIIPAVGHHERLRAGDRLIFAGATSAVVELLQSRGLIPVTERIFTLKNIYPERCLVEAVVAPHCALVNETLAAGRFRTYYGASVIAVSRGGARVEENLGDIRLNPGDILLLETRPAFIERHRNARDFLLVSAIPDSERVRFERAWASWLILLSVVISSATGWLSMLNASMLGAAAMLISRCCSLDTARRNIDVQVLLAIAAAFGLGEALRSSGAAEAIALNFMSLAGTRPWLLLIYTYLLTAVLTAVVTNNAVAVMMFPIVLVAAENANISAMPLIIAVMMGASASFATPIGYQTNLMVYGLGGYRFGDYLRFGIPLNILVGVVTVLVIPLVWPFRL
jgi:di/tricarboxylate transporter